MGSSSDWDVMQHCVQTLESLGIANERRVLSAHRTPQAAIEWCGGAKGRGLKVIIAAAGGAAHLAGVASAMTPLPVLGVPVPSTPFPHVNVHDDFKMMMQGHRQAIGAGAEGLAQAREIIRGVHKPA